MHIIPKTRQEWIGLVLFPFKAYTVVAFPCFMIIDHNGWLFRFSKLGGDIIFGYLLAGAILIIAGLVQKYVFKSQTAASNFGFGIAAIFIGCFIMPMFAPA